MHPEDLAQVITQAMWALVWVSTPVLLVALCVGLLFSIVQTVTQIQEPTLTFLPKLIGIMVTLIVAGSFMFHTMEALTHTLVAYMTTPPE